MSRRKSAVAVLLVALIVLVLSPWATAPSSVVPSTDRPPQESKSPAPTPTASEQPAVIRVAVPMEEAEFDALAQDNEAFELRHPDIRVELVRVQPQDARAAFRQEAKLGELPDIVLLPNEWVGEFAVSGYLLSVDAAYFGEAQSEQFDAVVAPLKWNGLWWAVPRDLDPYVVAWNRRVLGQVAPAPDGGTGAAAALERWRSLPKRLKDAGLSASWLALDDGDPQALLAFLTAAAGSRTDEWLSRGSGVWNGQPLEGALSLLEQERSGVRLGTVGDAAFWQDWAEGKAAAAIMPYSAAWQAAGRAELAAVTEIDRSMWEAPFVWPGGRSFALSARTAYADAARTWVSEMTDAAHQRSNYERSGRLPVYRSLYAGADGIRPSLSAAGARQFPNVAPASAGPELPAALDTVRSFGQRLLRGKLTVEEWKKKWPQSLPEFQADG